MNPRKERRWDKLKIALFAIPLLVIGCMALAPVQVLRPVLDSEGQPVFREDGRRMMETDHWGNFKANWVGFTLIYTGIGVIIWGVGGWLYEGLVRGREITTASNGT
jgi:hypothetical protein